jgi:hypothetical protein
MSTIVSIFGANASGKSSLVRSLMERLGKPSPFLFDGKTAGYRFTAPSGQKVFILGKYTTACGGLDATFNGEPYCNNPLCGRPRKDKAKVCAHCGLPLRKAADDCVEVVGQLADRGHVVCEGIIAMSSWGHDRLVNLAKDQEACGHKMIFALLSPPWDVVLDRLTKRQAASGRVRSKPFDPEKTVHKKHNEMPRTIEKLKAAGCDARVMNWEDPLPELTAWLGLS